MESQTVRLYNQPYENGFTPTMTAYLCDEETRGAVIIFPGGGYTHYGSAEQTLVAKRFNELGFHAFVVIYSVAPLHYPCQQKDGFRAIKMVRKDAEKYHVDPNKIAVCGFSAGGHLAGSMGVLWNKFECICNDRYDDASQRPDAMILSYPVISMSGNYSHIGSANNLIGSDDPELREFLSLEKQIDSETPPAFCWITADDRAVNRENPIVFAQNMWNAGRDCELHVFPHGPHGLGLNTSLQDVSQWITLAATFLRTTCAF